MNFKVNSKVLIIGILVVIVASSCSKKPLGEYRQPEVAPDYSDLYYWAAHPDKDDMADVCPEGLQDKQANALVDVFYLHPTIYYGKRKYTEWNAPIHLEGLNNDVDETAIKNQATVFNGIGKVYAPRYRQAHINAYYHKDTTSAKKAFDLAYEDIKTAFEYYLKYYNKGRPIIIASHSQGTTHSQRLIKEYFDKKPLKEKLIVGYLAGIRVDMDQYHEISKCDSPAQTGCLTGWRTFKNGATPDFLAYESDNNILITNPITWSKDQPSSTLDEHKGAVLLDFEAKPKENLIEATVHESILWTTKPKFKGSFFLTTKNYHRGDINLFYMDIRENAALRTKAYFDDM